MLKTWGNKIIGLGNELGKTTQNICNEFRSFMEIFVWIFFTMVDSKFLSHISLEKISEIIWKIIKIPQIWVYLAIIFCVFHWKFICHHFFPMHISLSMTMTVQFKYWEWNYLLCLLNWWIWFKSFTEMHAKFSKDKNSTILGQIQLLVFIDLIEHIQKPRVGLEPNWEHIPLNRIVSCDTVFMNLMNMWSYLHLLIDGASVQSCCLGFFHGCIYLSTSVDHAVCTFTIVWVFDLIRFSFLNTSPCSWINTFGRWIVMMYALVLLEINVVFIYFDWLRIEYLFMRFNQIHKFIQPYGHKGERHTSWIEK